MSHVFSSPPPYQRVCRRSSHSSVTSQWHIWQEASVCVCVRERGLNVLPSTDLWILTFYTPVKPHLEVAPLVFSPLQPLDLPPPPRFHFSSSDTTLLGHPDFRVTERTCYSPSDFSTSWTEQNSAGLPWRRLPAAAHAPPLASGWNKDLEKVFNLAKVSEHVTEESW